MKYVTFVDKKQVFYSMSKNSNKYFLHEDISYDDFVVVTVAPSEQGGVVAEGPTRTTYDIRSVQCHKETLTSCIFSSGYFPGVKLQLVDVSEPCISSIFKGWVYSSSSSQNLGRGYKTPCFLSHLTLYTQPFEDGTDTGFRNVGQLQFDAGEIPRRKYTIFKSRRKSEIKNTLLNVWNM